MVTLRSFKDFTRPGGSGELCLVAKAQLGSRPHLRTSFSRASSWCGSSLRGKPHLTGLARSFQAATSQAEVRHVMQQATLGGPWYCLSHGPPQQLAVEESVAHRHLATWPSRPAAPGPACGATCFTSRRASLGAAWRASRLSVAQPGQRRPLSSASSAGDAGGAARAPRCHMEMAKKVDEHRRESSKCLDFDGISWEVGPLASRSGGRRRRDKQSLQSCCFSESLRP